MGENGAYNQRMRRDGPKQGANVGRPEERIRKGKRTDL
jgi:hypothetical protein